MKSIINLFTHNWQRKLLALFTAIVIWLFINNSINETRTIPNISVRIINLPSDKTISGLMSNGMLNRRITLTLTGSKEVIDNLESSDLEVLLDASLAQSDDWSARISKKNLVSLNPSIDLLQHIAQVADVDYFVKFSRLMTARIPVTILQPTGTPPQGYEYLDIWPQHLIQTVSGPEEELSILKERGLEIAFNLNDISKSDLDAFKSQSGNEEISFPIPKKWKRVIIQCFGNDYQELNDPEAQNLTIDFLRQEFLPLASNIPVTVYYPPDDLETLNPEVLTLAPGPDFEKKYGVIFLTKPLYTKSVSRLFNAIVHKSMQIVIIAAPKAKRQVLSWSLQFINTGYLEDLYIASAIANSPSYKGIQTMLPKKREEMLRKRFRTYMNHLTLYLADMKKLHLKSTIDNNQIHVIAY